MLFSYKDKMPSIAEDCFIAENASVIGNVQISEESSVWYGAVIRAEESEIKIGKNSNVQDNAVLHCDAPFPTTLGDNVTVGHSAIVHGCTVGDNVIVGMHATLLNGCIVGENSIVGAGALVKEGQMIPPGSLVVGVPAKVIRSIDEKGMERIRATADTYKKQSKEHKENVNRI